MNPAIEGWRGLAALLVMLAHFGPAAGLDHAFVKTAFTGVDLFFVLSGFVFGPILFGQEQQWRAYALRRAFRIVPAYWLAVAVYALILWAQTGSAGPWVQHLFFLHLSSPQTAFALNPAFWSLVPEVEFYLLLPFLAQWVRGRNQRFIALLFGALLLRLMLGSLADRASANIAFVVLHHLPGMLIEFLLGAAVWRLQGQARKTWLFALGFLLWIALALAFGRFGDAGFDAVLGTGQVSLIAALAASLMLAGSIHLPLHDGPVRAIALLAGSLSYGVYLFHNAALSLMPSVRAAVLATLIIAAGVHWVLESPARRLGRQLAARVTSPT